MHLMVNIIFFLSFFLSIFPLHLPSFVKSSPVLIYTVYFLLDIVLLIFHMLLLHVGEWSPHSSCRPGNPIATNGGLIKDVGVPTL